MKNLILGLALVLGAGSQAKADDSWMCGLTYRAQTKAIQVLVGKFEINGKGTLRCENINGDKRELPVTLTAKGKPFALRVAIGEFEVFGASANINLGARQPEDLLGKYHFVQAQAVVVGGVGVIVGSHLNDKDLTIHLSVNALRGLGFNFGVSTMTMALDQSRLQ